MSENNIEWQIEDGFDTHNDKLWKGTDDNGERYQAEFVNSSQSRHIEASEGFFVCVIRFHKDSDLFMKHDTLLHTIVDTRSEANERLSEFGISFD